MPFRLRPDMLAPAFGGADGGRFLGIVSRSLFGAVELARSDVYETAELAPADAAEIPDLVEALDGSWHVFCLTADASFHSPPPSAIPELKLGVLPLYSTGFSRSKLVRALAIIESIDYRLQHDRSRRLIEDLDGAERLLLRSPRFGTKAVLELWSGPGPIHFFNQSGPIGVGHQSVLPGGEVSLLTDGHGDYSRDSKFALDGELVVRGTPVLHRGTCPCHIARACAGVRAPEPTASCTVGRPSVVAQARLFRALEPVARSAALLRVREGVVSAIAPLESDSSFVDGFTGLVDRERDYQKVHEIGFGINEHAPLSGENFLPNEMVRGIHFGFGLTPYTGFHLDLVSRDLVVIAETGRRSKTLLHPV